MDHLPPPLQFEVREGLNQNLFYQSSTTACAAVVTTETRPRILLTFPAGNSGLGLWADAANPDNQDLQLEASGPLVEQDGSIHMVVHANHSQLAFTQVELDSVRAIRNQDESDDCPEQLRSRYTLQLQAPPFWAWPEVIRTDDSITFRRVELNGQPWVLKLDLTPGTRIEWGDPTMLSAGHLKNPLRLVNPDGQPLQFTVEGQVPFAPLTPLSPQQLFNPTALRLLPSASPRYQDALRELRMLIYQEKYLAGTWHFETYFGRDTLLSLSLLSNTLNPTALLDGIDSVLSRLSHEGVVAHEEDIGAWAEIDALHSVDDGGPIPDNWEAPRYDYKMVDSDFLLPLAEHELPPAQQQQLLHSPHLVDVLRNYNRVLTQASYDMVRINPGFTVGDWRDSDGGLCGGVYAGDINTTLVPCALADIERSLAMLPAAQVKSLARQNDFTLVEQCLAHPDLLTALRWHWNAVRKRFAVSLSPAEVKARVAAYLASQPADRQAALGQQLILGGPTINEWLQGAPVPGWDGHLRFWALSLDTSRHAVPVLNSDMCFRLFYGNPPPGELADMVRSARLPFPLGLMTPIGMVVADPAYSANPQLWKSLDWDAYHGVVVWGWQHNMMALGLRRQMARYRNNPQLLSDMAGLLQQLQASEARTGALTSSELWTWDVQDGQIVPLAFGVRSTSADESDALQLWSAAWAGVYVGESAPR